MSLAQGSPRLPSPPPPAEIQLGPKSPGLGSTASRQLQQMEQTIADANAKRRIHPGTKSEDMAAGPPLVPLGELDSAFQLQEHLASLHYHLTNSNTTPITRATAVQLATPPAGIDRTLWLYELCRFLIAQCNSLIVGFLFDTPPCSSATCPEMRASEWQFLCAVHDQPKSCCAIDYCCHTLDWAANVVTNPKIFPSRFVLVSEGHDKSSVLKNLVNVFRRLHRIFAHAWFQHRGVFWSVEAQTGLYAFFKTVCDMYDLLPAENYKLPPEAEGLEPVPSEKQDRNSIVTAIAKPPSQHENTEHDDHHSLHARRTNTARHSSRPSTGSAVTTVIEEREDEQQEMANKLKGMHISAPETVEEESEVEVPVIVEGELIDTSTVIEATEAPQAPELSELNNAHSQGVKIDVQEDVPMEPETAAEHVEEPTTEVEKEVPLNHEQPNEEKTEEPATSTEEEPAQPAQEDSQKTEVDTTEQPEPPTTETAQEPAEAEKEEDATQEEGSSVNDLTAE
ncbi:Mob1/phocein [Annulohypoxylon truncatum]|uniref:Mob1/phocein n=1 Tax=Annulohypoxylon truncatum TaxID=327061 RepID=UPI002008A2D8|nr:Mob1/phocein [Annulohypoxylon truncatum]KAI1210852.1 Mob1/phocein [Annulohypoxylon truncatum]